MDIKFVKSVFKSEVDSASSRINSFFIFKKNDVWRNEALGLLEEVNLYGHTPLASVSII